jgi:hypothetical protein
MVFSAELLAFGLYFAQQIGVLLAIGAQTILLSGHLLDTHAERFNEHLRTAARWVRFVGIALIVISGGAVGYFHFIAGETAVLEEPAFVFKWLLVALLLGFHLLDTLQRGRGIILWLEGASWYALFLVHTLAPVISWKNILIAYGAWIIAFGIVWGIFLYAVTPRKKKNIVPIVAQETTVLSKPVVTPPPPNKPVVPVATAVQVPPPAKTPEHPLPALHAVAELPAPVKEKIPTPPPPPPVPVAPKVAEPPKKEIPMPELDQAGLPAIHVMPQKPEDIGKHLRAAGVQFTSE